MATYPLLRSALGFGRRLAQRFKESGYFVLWHIIDFVCGHERRCRIAGAMAGNQLNQMEPEFSGQINVSGRPVKGSAFSQAEMAGQ
jgi:hypothetical protein